jgi:hypothetical protein
MSIAAHTGSVALLGPVRPEKKTGLVAETGFVERSADYFVGPNV